MKKLIWKFQFIFVVFLPIFIHMKSFSNEEQSIEVNYAPFKFTLLSDYTDLNIISSNRSSDISENNFVLGILYAKTNYLYGLGISAFSLYVENDMYGMQISPINIATGNSIGVQAGLFNYSKDFYGAQLSLLNYSDDFYGVQIATVNTSHNLYGAQYGIYNKSRNTYGLQIGVLNHSDDFEGVQIGIVNIAKNIKGFQVGIINVADDQTGYSFGILSFLLKSGFAKMYFRYDTDIPLNIGIKAGSKYFYSIAEINIPKPFSNTDLAKYALIGVYPSFAQISLIGGNFSTNYNPNGSYLTYGIGTQISFDPVMFALEARWVDIFDKTSEINSFKLGYTFLVGTKINREFEIFLNTSLNSNEIPGKITDFQIDKYIPSKNYNFAYGAGVSLWIFGNNE